MYQDLYLLFRDAAAASILIFIALQVYSIAEHTKGPED